MSQEIPDLLRRAFEYVEETGEILREAVHPDFVWDTTTFRGAIRPGTYVGVDEVNEWLADWFESFENWSLDIEEVFDAGDQLLTIVRQHGKAKHGGPEVEMRFAQIRPRWRVGVCIREGRLCGARGTRPSRKP